jgi:hypothetical protein
MLVNGFLSFKFLTGQLPSLRDITNVVAQALCGDKEGEADHVAAGGPDLKKSQEFRKARRHHHQRGSNKQRSKGHLLVWGPVGSKRKQGPCNLSKERHANGVCRTCANGLDTDSLQPFRLCSIGPHGRQCYCQHLHEMLIPRKRRQYFCYFSAYAESLLNRQIFFLQ